MFHFAPFDLIDTVTMSSGAIETTTYDTLGQVTSHFSPVSGTAIKMAYLRRLWRTAVQPAKESGAVTSLNYDTIGRSTGVA
jgi:YD repeat-containing protein